MEDDKKKRKKNKKKKNKQTNEPTESDTLDAKELASDGQSHVQETGPANNGQVPDIVDVSNVTRGHINPDGDGDLDNENEVVYLDRVEKQRWLDREVTLEGKIKELQAENDAQIQKEASLEERIKQLIMENDRNSEKEAMLKERQTELEKEKDALIQKECSLEHKIQQLQKEMDAQLQKEGSLVQRIQHLQREMDATMQKEATLEKEIQELKDEKVSWVQKEADFEQKLNQMVDQASLLNLKVVSLEDNVKHMEKERDSWILKENSAKESIASLTIDNTKLRAQVVEMELSRESLFSETQQLKEFISTLQLQINNLEMDKKTSENGHLNSEVEAAGALVERLMAENAQLVEKVNNLHAELEQSGVRSGQFTPGGSVPEAVTGEIPVAAAPMPDQASGASKMIPVSDSVQPLEDAMVKDERNGELVNVNPGSRGASSSEIIEADQTVQIPLDENEVKQSNLEMASQSDGNADVSLVDSPLIGAPFRMISFVARYVSGADLVHRSNNTG